MWKKLKNTIEHARNRLHHTRFRFHHAHQYMNLRPPQKGTAIILQGTFYIQESAGHTGTESQHAHQCTEAHTKEGSKISKEE